METAPLLGLAIVLVTVGMVAIGVVLMVLLRQRSWARLLGLTMVLTGVTAASLLAFAVAYLGEWTDLNPAHVRDRDVAKTWVSTGLLTPHQVVTFREDGTFVFMEGERLVGRWSRHDWNLWLSPRGKEVETWRVVNVNGSYRLLRHYCGIEDTCGKRQVTFRAR